MPRMPRIPAPARTSGRSALLRWPCVARIAPFLLAVPTAASARAEVIVITSPWAGGTIAPGDTVRLDDGASVDGAVENNGTLQFNTTVPISVSAANVISGSGAVQVTNTGTVTLSAANTYGGATTITAGRLNLSGGDDRLPTTTALSISGGSLDVGAGSQTVRNFTATGGTVLGSGTLAVTAATGGVRNVTMTNLANFAYDAGNATVNFGGQAVGEGGVVVLPAGSSQVRAATYQQPVVQNSSAAVTSGQVQFGADTMLQANTIRIARGVRTSATALFATGLTDPKLTIRAQDGTGRAAIEIGWLPIDTSFSTAGILNTEAGTLDALVSTAVVGHGERTNVGGGTGSLLMGAGTLDAQTIILGRSVSTQPGNGTLRVTGGTVVVDTLNMGVRGGGGAATASFTLQGGGTLEATTVTPGAGATSTFTWNEGTIRNKAGGDLTINGGFTTFDLATAGSHAFAIDAGRTGSVATNMTGVGMLTKAGGGTLELSGVNTYAGGTDLTAGRLLVNGSIAGGVTVAAAAELGGSGTVGGTIGGGGLVGPGNSPGITTAAAVDSGGGLDFAFEFTGTGSPSYGTPAASVNDVLRLTGSTPFTSNLGATNAIDVYFLGDIAKDDLFRGGFYLDIGGDFTAAVEDAIYTYWVSGNGAGTDTTYNGQGYYALANYDAALWITAEIVAEIADFGGGPVNGSVMQFTVVPEPSALAMGAIGMLICVGAAERRRRWRWRWRW